MTPLSPVGTVAWPVSLSPQATTVPSLFSARLCTAPAAMAITPLSPAGTLRLADNRSLPQATTVPSLFSARLW